MARKVGILFSYPIVNVFTFCTILGQAEPEFGKQEVISVLKENDQAPIMFDSLLGLYEKELLQESYNRNTVLYHIQTLRRVYDSEVSRKLTYSPDKARIWLKEQRNRQLEGQISHKWYVFMQTAIEQFDQFCLEGRLMITRRYEHPGRLNECFHSIHQEFSLSLPQKLAQSTRKLYVTNSRQFFEYLEKHSILDLKSITHGIIVDYLAAAATHHERSMDKVIQALKLLFIFLSDKGFVGFNMDFATIKPACRRKPVLPCFTYDEVKSLLALIDRTTAIGKRDYAIVLIAIYTGLRSQDIYTMRLKDVNWRKQEISITQKKTGNAQCIPLCVDAGNALADYILNGRPSSKDECIFVKNVAPYTRLDGHGNGTYLLEKYIKLNPALAEKSSNKTFHSFRRSLGSWLSAVQTPLPLISEILGHTNLEASKFYLSYDNSSMSLCCLGLDGIPVLKGELA